MKKASLSIGINHFDYFPNSTLSGCLLDVEHTSSYFFNSCDSVAILRECDATEAGVKAALLDFKGRKWQEDFYGIICLSSHGSHVPSKTEKDGYDEITVCKDFDGESGGILDDWWYEYLQDIPQSSAVYILADTCMSTGLTRALGHGRYLFNPLCENKNKCQRGLFFASDSAVDLADDYPGVLFPGCGENGTSSDTPNGGAMTCAFLEALKEAGEAPINRDLVLAVRKKLAAGGFAQKPTLQCSKHYSEQPFQLWAKEGRK